MKYFVVLLTWILSFSAYAQVSNSNAAPDELHPNVRGALCYIQADDQVVFIKEVITKRFSLPGGTIEKGEDPRLTAKRETWEETGIVVNVGDVLTKTDTAIIYSCEPQSGIIAFSQRGNNHGFHILPSWFAPDFSIESAITFIAYPSLILPNTYRYPDQFEQQVLNHSVVNSPIKFIDSALSSAPLIHQYELPYIEQIQDQLNSLPHAAYTNLLMLLQGFNYLFSAYSLLILLPIVMLHFGMKRFAQLTFLASLTATIAIALQFSLKFARPFVYQPSLALVNTLGFGTPSLGAALSVVLIGYMHYLCKQKRSEKSTVCAIGAVVLMLLQGSASVVLGMQFITDVLFGYAMGLLLLWHYIRLNESRWIAWQTISIHPLFWCVWSVVLTGIAAYSHIIQMGKIAALCWSLTLIMAALKYIRGEMFNPNASSRFEVEHSDSIEGLVSLRVFVSWIGSAALLVGMKLLIANVQLSSFESYYIQCGLWLAVVIFVFLNTQLHLAFCKFGRTEAVENNNY
ncbi:MAG: bifunctional NUDIX hydrolase/phosphatase PAP2 family protein [Vibrio sp.]